MNKNYLIAFAIAFFTALCLTSCEDEPSGTKNWNKANLALESTYKGYHFETDDIYGKIYIIYDDGTVSEYWSNNKWNARYIFALGIFKYQDKYGYETELKFSHYDESHLILNVKKTSPKGRSSYVDYIVQPTTRIFW